MPCPLPSPQVTSAPQPSAQSPASLEGRGETHLLSLQLQGQGQGESKTATWTETLGLGQGGSQAPPHRRSPKEAPGIPAGVPAGSLPSPCSTPRARAARPSGFLPLFLQNLYLELKMLPHAPYKEVNTDLLCGPVTLGYLCRTKEKTTVPTRPSLGN